MPTNRDRRTYGTTVHPHLGQTPTKQQADRRQLINQALNLINAKVGAYIEEHDKDNHWATAVRYYYQCLVKGQRPSGTVKLDGETKRLVRQWVGEALKQTGLRPPQRATKKKPKRR
jgi:GH24 family phage-related lysozyme (muramidase)